ncbi:MAG: NirD/YgiW/YdeI family stress tolerance protein [Campylobacter sp.]|uniref:NirD/YgiW/YdeI family stress tolerance protein n=1 Tax=Campylobacter sp. TaxID=205 RepID=UPI0029790D1E|nr:NirD/YgiW/YdeI family stress tolerance protein [Campylobacter sp.]MDD7742071.1 NirD/YgiW/YdeI family stress tolerance protein [Campylobacteraceae bacterium]MCI7363016.1 NirD/YgiW/YdeI family stress tolerance protein [Campylobacter sp.]MCI7501430.1 NirD/YgiW/YdeI family stress tolerance protein [Campylobacter sp.]MDY4121163.1 NirD/YgiW/YdeI family stress tolerance protein [Campylobacter sp.]MDY4803554.1 NirD/YgiW/YdeI family stress tolerance protein [Campylobacter sp.]
MKKVLLSSVLVLSLFGAGFQDAKTPANQENYGGFTGPQAQGANTVAGALKARDDTMVTLKGNIIRQVAHEKYEFKDSTGVMIVEIDDDKWNGLSVGPNDVVEIYGEVDSEIYRKNEVDVKFIKKVN